MKNSWIRLPGISVLLALAGAMVLSVPAQIQQAWTRSFVGSFAGITLDGQDNLYLTGTESGDFVTLKYAPGGSLVWSNRYDGGSAEAAGTVAADAAGQVWVSGVSQFTNGVAQSSAVTIKYDASGSLSWTQRFASNVLSTALVLDTSGNSYVGGLLANWSFYLVKYSPGGDQLWARTFVPAGNWYVVFNGFTVDGSNNVLLAGVTYLVDYDSPKQALIKYDGAGNLLWSDENIPILGGYYSAIRSDAQGSTFISAKTFSAAKVGPDGVLNWTRLRTGPRPGFDFSNLEIDPAGNLVIAGTDAFFYKICSDCGDSGYNFYLITKKLSPAGAVLWPERSYKDFGFGRLQFDADGSCYVGGRFSSFSDDALPPHPDTILAKYAPNGAELWRTNFSTGTMGAMKVDGGGNLYLVTQNAVTAVRKFIQTSGPPTVSLQPQSRTILDSDDVSFRVGGAGFPSPLFQWRLNEASLPGETNETLFLTVAHTNQAGGYTAVLSNSMGSITSAVATLTVNVAAPTVTAQFTAGGTQALVGAAVTICAQATGGPKPTLQWRFNGTDLPGETNACLALGPAQVSQSGTYSIVANNGLGTAAAFVSLNVIPMIIYSSYPTPVSVGTCVYFSSSIGFTSQYSLQWLLNGTPLSNENNPWLYRCLIDSNDAGFYALVVSHSSGTYTSAPIELIVYYAPPTNASPSFFTGHTAALVGEDVSLYASYVGSPGFIQWRFNGANLPGETNRTLPLLGIMTSQAGQYSFFVTNIAGATTSTVAAISVSYQPPIFVTHPASQAVVEGGTARFDAYAPAGPPPVYFLEHNGTNVAVPFTYECCFSSAGGFKLLDTTFEDAGDYRIIASNSLGKVTSSAATLTVTPAGPLDRWTQRNPLPQSQSILAVAHGTNQFVAVGDRGTIMTSPDGATWALQNRRVDLALQGVAYGQGLFVVVGEGGTILSSSDGTNWAYRYSAASTPLNAVAFGAGGFIAVGTTVGLSTLILHSTDGIHWDRIPLNGFYAERCVAYGNGLFIAAGSSSLVVSSNGTNWSLALNVGTEIESITYGNGIYVAVGNDGAVLVSTNGSSWVTRAPVTTRRLLGVFYGAGRFVASGARGTVITSTDSVTWTPVTSGTPDRMETIDFFSGSFVTAGENGTILTSTDGMNWTKRNFGITRDLDGLSVANGTLVVVGKGGSILTSADGVHYTVQNAGVTNDLHGVTWGGGLWVAVGEPGIILTSSNSVNWTTHTSGTTNSLKNATYANGQWIVVGTQGTIVRSTNGTSWATTYTSPAYDLNDVAYGNGLFLVAGDGPLNANGSVFKSTDGVAWTQVSYNPSKNLRGVTFANGLFLIAANDGFVFTTSNAVSFSNVLSFGQNLRGATWAKGLWLVVGNDGVITTSPDTTTWTFRGSRTFENLHQVAWLDGRFVTIGNAGTILQSGRLDVLLEVPRYIAGSGLHIPFQGVLNRTYQIQASSNLVNWINLLTFTNQSEHGEFTDTNALQLPRRFYRLSQP